MGQQASTERTTGVRTGKIVRAETTRIKQSNGQRITKGERGVSADTALRLERYFGSEAKGWLSLQAAFELRVAEMENGKTIAKEIQPLALAV